ncbi:MAG: AAA family ATPase, partial [Firmicutes bacterium]|nr:AAA family ATPase [Bacillota bacterium]
MKDVMSVKEAARLWGVSETRIARLCREERIMGAVKEGRSWVLPIDAQYPQDNRITSGRYIRQTDKMKLPLPVGVSDYKKASEDYYYVDKTLLIKDFLDERPIVSLFTRPRRFGKTLNMDMLRVFFEKTEEDTSVYFRDKEIWACGSRYREHQGKYPVIFLTFKDIKKETWEETYQAITWTISQEYKRHTELAGSSRIQDCAYYDRISSGNADQADLEISLYMLSKMLHDYHGVAPIVMIDEYDTPIQQGHVYGFYEKVVLFMRNFFSGGLKDNPHLSYGFLTGILRVAKESIFSGLNNLKVNSILDDRYGRYFGFTPEEVKKMTVYYGVPEKYEEICAWYDGYRFGQTEIFNPWSVINYFSN